MQRADWATTYRGILRFAEHGAASGTALHQPSAAPWERSEGVYLPSRPERGRLAKGTLKGSSGVEKEQTRRTVFLGPRSGSRGAFALMRREVMPLRTDVSRVRPWSPHDDAKAASGRHREGRV